MHLFRCIAYFLGQLLFIVPPGAPATEVYWRRTSTVYRLIYAYVFLSQLGHKLTQDDIEPSLTKPVVREIDS